MVVDWALLYVSLQPQPTLGFDWMCCNSVVGMAYYALNGIANGSKFVTKQCCETVAIMTVTGPPAIISVQERPHSFSQFKCRTNPK